MKAKDWNRAYNWGFIGSLVYCLALWGFLIGVVWWML